MAVMVDTDGDLIVPTYAVEARDGEEARELAGRLASHFFPGTQNRVAGETDAMRDRHGARILAIEEEPAATSGTAVGSNAAVRTFRVSIAIPRHNLGDSIAMLLSTVGGEVLAYGRIRLVYLSLPAGYLDSFPGPRFGAAGIRRLLGVPRRPLLLAITKPCLGFTPEEGGRTFFEAAVGGADIVKDDELLSDPGYCSRALRVKHYLAAERRAFEEKGERTLYAVNITDRADRLPANARQAVELGANALMLNWLEVGPDAARAVCEEAGTRVPVLGHNAGATALSAGSGVGIDGAIVSGLLPRLCGIDLAIFLTQHGKYPSTREGCLAIVAGMRRPLGRLQPVLPVPAGGVTPALVATLVEEYGTDIAIGAGGPLFGHPGGPRAGAAAFRAGIASVMEHKGGPHGA
jgi:2,3-diketo-5-methylthiopentyl-1-phosphate enolase